MRRTTELLLAMIAFLFISAHYAAAQKPQRIQFERGKSSAVVRASTGQHGTTYILRARSGQILVVDLTPAQKVGIKIETVGRFGEMVILREEQGGHYEVGLEETGDYTIFIGSLEGRPVPFTLTVGTKKLRDI